MANVTLTDPDSKPMFDIARYHRKTVRSKITTVANRVTAIHQSGRSDPIVLDSEEITIKNLGEEVGNLDREIRSYLALPKTDAEEKERQTWEARCTEYEEKIAATLGKINQMRQQQVKTSLNASFAQGAASAGQQPGAVLTNLTVLSEPKIPKFAGDVKKFRDWLVTYESATESCSSDLARFRKLKEALVGPAYKVIACIELSEENFKIAIDKVKDEYGRVFNAQYAHALDIIRNAESKDFKNPDKWFTLVPYVDQNVQNLRLIIKEFEGAAAFILPLLLENIPPAIKEAFLRVHEVSVTGEAVKQLDSLISFMKKEHKIRSTADSSKAKGFSDRNKFQKFKQGAKPSSSDHQKSKDNHSFYGKQDPEGDHSCIFCDLKNHPSHKCRKVMTNAERAEIIQKAGACAKCLRRNHVAAKCRQKTKCKSCSGGHHSLLCIKATKVKETQQNTVCLGTSDAVSRQTSAEELDAVTAKIARQANLATGYAFVVTEQGKELRRILLDTGSQRSFITNRLAKCLKAKVVRKDLLINHTLGGKASEVTEFKDFSVSLMSRFGSEQLFPIKCLGIPTITQSKFPPAEKINGITDHADLVKDPIHKEIDILLGAEDIGQIWLNESVSEGKLIGINTRLGWFTFGSRAPLSHFTTSLSAQQTGMSESHQGTSVSSEEANNDTTSNDIDFLFKTELLGIEAPSENEKEKLLEQERFDKIFKNCIRRLPSGRLSLKLPFNDKLPTLGTNEHLAQIRLKNLIAKASPEVLEAADAEITHYLENGYAEYAPERKEKEFAHFLPLQIIKKQDPGSPQGFKIRLVKDAGARSKDLAALNDVLIQGQNLLPNILEVLTRFRESPLIVCMDVCKAFHQIEIDRAHRTFLRFFWRPGIARDANAPLRELWANRLEFGLSASPWLFQAALKFHLESQIKKRPDDSNFIKEIMSSTYMDDCHFQALNLDEALSKTKKCIEIFGEASFSLAKWAVNSKALAEAMHKGILKEEVAIRYDDEYAKFLGVRWCQKTDRIGVFVSEALQGIKDNKPSKRSLLSAVARVFDPLGLASCTTIQAKILLQSLWRAKIDWDEELVGDHLRDYNSFASQLQGIENLTVKRTNANINNAPLKTEIHAFADASKLAYGAVIFTREFFKKGRPKVKFIIAKAKVTPIKGSWNIPRLELLSAVIAVRLVESIKEALGKTVVSVTYWTDNSAVLGWTREKPSAWKVFVSRRIEEIQKFSTPNQWKWVSTNCNPADLLSRGMPLDSEETRRFWTQGPKWLSDFTLPAPEKIGKSLFEEAIREAKKVDSIATMSAVSETSEKSYILKEKHFSSWPKAVRSLAYVIRFIRRCRDKKKLWRNINIDSTEFENAESALIKDLQRIDFCKEVENKCVKTHRTSKLFMYNPKLGEDGVIRCQSRLIKSGDLSWEEKFPIILDGRNYFVRLLIYWIHSTKTLHAQGISTNLHHLRSKFLVLRARSSTLRVLRDCKVCAKFRAKPASEVTPPLPAFRIQESPPFSITGTDFCGPIKVRNQQGEKFKAYICLFVCPLSRACHLELTPSLTTFDFLLVLRKFIARFPSVRIIMSDNASTYKRSKTELGLAQENIRSKEIQNFLSKSQIKWEFITDRAPVQGANWERIVQLVKRPLRKIIGTNVPRFDELASVLAEIELCINLRPISALPSKDCEARALCPMDLLFGYHAASRFPDSSVLALSKIKDQDAIILTTAWKRQQTLLNGFWKRFKTDYLQQLRSAHERKPKESRPLSKGDICLLADKSPSRSFWPICRIVDVFGGARTDLRQRSCLVKIGGKTTPVKRPISSLYPLGFGSYDS